MLASVFHRTLPAIQKGYPLPPLFSVIVPIARTNLVTNPSVEVATTNYTAVGGSIARSTTQQYHGAYSLAVTPTAGTTDGVKYGSISLTSGTLYAISCKFLGVAGVKYALSIATTGGVGLGSYRFRATGRWQWIWLYYLETASTTRDLYVQKDVQTSTGVFYVDGLQVEAINAGEYVSTYIDGDQQGLIANQFPPAYVWTGTPHASTSSRSGQTRAGGMVMRLDWYGFLLLTMIGLGLPIPTNISQQYVQLDGAAYERTSKGPRQFTLGGRFDAQTFPQLQRQISDLTSVLDRDYVATQQPLTLLYQGVDGCDVPTSTMARIICSYQGGLEGVTDNLHAEQTSAVFRQWLPAILSDGEAGLGYGAPSSIANANHVIMRTPAGAWQALSTGASGGNVDAFVRGLDGAYYIGGEFTSFGGVANTRAICKYDPVTGAVTALGTGATSGNVIDLQVAPNGDIYAVGSFQDMGGVAAADYVARWDGSAWNALATPSANSGSYAAPPSGVFGADGSFYYTDGLSPGHLYKWNGSAWSTIWTTGGVTQFALVRAANGDIIISTGTAVNIGGVNTTVARWDGSAITAVGAYTTGVTGLTFDAAGNLYAVGSTALAVFNGVVWTTIGTFNGALYRCTTAPDGSILIAGIFTTVNGVTLPESLAQYKNGAFTYLEIDLPGTFGVDSTTNVRTLSDGAVLVGFTGTGSANVMTQTATNTGTARAYPMLTIRGPSSGTSRIYQLINYTTGRSIYLNYTINPGETARFVFDPAYLSFTSDFQGNITSKILPGSTEADFFIQPGANVINLWASNASTMSATLTWRPAYNSTADLTS